MSFPAPFYKWRPHPWHGLDPGPDVPRVVEAYIELKTEEARMVSTMVHPIEFELYYSC